MVRLKPRWLLIQVDMLFPNSDQRGAIDPFATPQSLRSVKVSKQDLSRVIQDQVEKSGGIAATAATVQVRWWDPRTHLALIRILPREWVALVRTALVTTTVMQLHNLKHVDHAVSAKSARPPRSNTLTIPLVLSVRSVHGSSRTAKRQAIHEVFKYYGVRRHKGLVVVTERRHVEESLATLMALDTF